MEIVYHQYYVDTLPLKEDYVQPEWQDPFVVNWHLEGTWKKGNLVKHQYMQKAFTDSGWREFSEANLSGLFLVGFDSV